MAPTFEIHLEEWNHALHLSGRGHKSDVLWLLDLLRQHKVHPVIFVLGDWIRENDLLWRTILMKGYRHGYHGEHHYYDEKANRSPYFNQEGQPGLCGGFYFRFLPLWVIKAEIKRTGLFYIHPHDLDENHPSLKNQIMHLKRHIGLKGAKTKLARLLGEVKFE